MTENLEEVLYVPINVHFDTYSIKPIKIQIPINSKTKNKSLVEKLAEDYYRTIKKKNGGHAVGFFRDYEDEIIWGKYEFPSGVYTIRSANQDNFFYWNYDIKEITKLKFSESLIGLIEKKEKHTSWRINDDKNIVSGMLLDFCNVNGKHFGYAITKSVKEITFEELTKKDKEGHESFASEEEMYSTFSRYYGFKVTSKTKLKVIKFEFL